MKLRTARDIGAFVRSARQDQGISQADLAKRAEVSRRWLVTLEQGKAGAELALVLRVFEALGVRLDATNIRTKEQP